MPTEDAYDDEGREQSSDGSLKADIRLYVSSPEGWEARVKQTSEKEYCYAQAPGQDYFHLLVLGEVYLVRDTEKFCLNCALRRGILTRNRTHWKRGPRGDEEM